MNVKTLKKDMLAYAKKHKIKTSDLNPNVNSSVWGLGARRLAWRVSKKALGKSTTNATRMWNYFHPKPKLAIIPKTYRWAYPLTTRTHAPGGVVWHNAAATRCTADAIHSWHLSNGWSGIAYHFFVTKDGNVYRGRPENKIGGHTLNFGTWLGICTEGNFDKEYMGAKQLAACIELRKYLDKKYHPRHKGHRDMPGNATSCPGRHFPLAKILK